MPLRKFEHFSASQLKTFGLCQRKWWLNKIAGVDEPQTLAQTIGVGYHGEAERYLKGGSHALSPVFAGGVRFLPLPGSPNLKVEVPIGIDKRNGAPKGTPLIRVDHTPAEGYMDVLILTPGHPVVIDHKFVSGFQHAPDEDALREDVQMILYGRAAMVLHDKEHRGWPSRVTVGHVSYDKTSPGSAIQRSVTFTLDQITIAYFKKIEPMVRAMVLVAKIETPDKVTPTWSACSAYRGCPHQKLCQNIRLLAPSLSEPTQPTGVFTMAFSRPTTTTVLPAVEGEQTPESIRASLVAHQQARAQGVTPGDAPQSTPVTQVAQTAAAAQTPAPAAGATNERKPRGYVEKFFALGWAKEDAERATTLAAKTIVNNGYTPLGWVLNASGDLGPKAVAVPIKEPKAPAGRDARIWLDTITAEGEDKIGGMASESNALGWNDDENGWNVGTTDDKPSVPALHPDMLVLVVNKQIRRDDKNLKLTIVDGIITGVTNEAPAPVVVAKVRAAAPVVEVVKTEAVEPSAAGALCLYVNCYPTKGAQTRHLEDILAPLQASVAEQKKKGHYLECGYRDGQSAVAALAMMQPGLFYGHILVDSDSPCAREILEILTPRATLIVRG